jgi:hypothetical protein
LEFTGVHIMQEGPRNICSPESVNNWVKNPVKVASFMELITTRTNGERLKDGLHASGGDRERKQHQ